MQLTALDIRALPGIDPIAIEDLAPGVNFIIGPNAIGKSSLARALHHLLAGRRPGDPSALTIAATFRHNGQTWVASRNGPEPSWQCDGEPTEPPPLPGAEVLHCYWLRAETLIAEDAASEAQLSRRLREALAGGIDLEAVRAAARLRPETFPRDLNKDWRAAGERRQAIERSYADLERERAELPQQQVALDEARQARDEIEQLRQGKRLREAIEARTALENQLSGFDPIMDALQGDEADTAEALRERIEKTRFAIESIKQKDAELGRRLNATGLAQAMPDQALMKALQSQLEELRRLEQDHARAREQLTQAGAYEQTAAEGLGTPPEPLPAFTPTQVEALTDALLALQEAKTWQTTTESAAPDQPASINGLIGLSALGGLLAMIGGGISTHLLALIGGLGALLGASGSWLMLRLSRRHTGANPAASQALANARAQVDQLIQQYGLSESALEGIGLARFMERVQQLDAARAQTAQAKAAVAELDERLQQQTSRIHEALKPWQDIPASDAAGLQAAYEVLSEQIDQARAIQDERKALQADQRRLQTELNDIQAQSDAIFTQAGLASDDRAGLQRLLAQHAHYRELTQALDQARMNEQALLTPLAEHPERLEWIKQASGAEIDAAMAKHEDRAAQIDPLTERIADLKARLAQTGSDQALTEAMAEQQSLAETLTLTREAHVQSTLGDWLLTQVESEYRQRHEPALIRDARERFETFTHQRWSFEVNESHEPVARDLRRNERRALTALSSGTRMQLLLAARIAWARDQERDGSPLPLILDEALTNTDAERFATIAENLQALAVEEDRQIFYLTARREDLALWAQATGRQPHCIDLGVIRKGVDAAAVLPTPAPVDEIPTPDGLDANTYGKALQVPAIDPMTDAGAIPIYYVLRDQLSVLHTLLNTWRIDRLGPLERWLESPAGRADVLNGMSREQLRLRARIARNWHALAREGRGRPVGYDALVASEAFTETMLPRVAEKAEALNGDAEALIEALRNREVPRLQQEHVEVLAQWLLDNGYLDPRPQRAPEQITAVLLEQLGHQINPELIQQLSASLTAGIKPVE